MSIWQAILLGLIQGLTEFIPISSTAHLTITGKLLGQINPEHPDEWTAFIAVLQLGTLLAVIIYFWTEILHIIAGFIKTHLAFFKKQPVSAVDKFNSLLGWLVIIGTIPAAVVGLLFRHQIEGVFTKDLRVIAGALIILALVLALAEVVAKHRRDMQQLTIRDAIIMGIAQVFALIPGCSRSGSTITGGLFAGLKRETAARFSFLMSIPAVAASGLLELPKILHSTHSSFLSLGIATIIAGVSGYASIAFLLRFLQHNSNLPFIVYRIILGLLIIGLLVSGKVSP
jgi:undecaprenyl-diphosphatase